VIRRLWASLRTGRVPTAGAVVGGPPRSSGLRAEALVARHLAWRGWRIVARNWIGGGGELDIVASRWRTLLVVEVRLRPSHEAAFASVDAGKLARTRAAAAALVHRHGLVRYRLSIAAAAVDPQGRIAITLLDD
jgi:putative endonuclease